jgi:hypothetical protein
MTLPPWRSADPREQQAFTRFIISELDRLDAPHPANKADEQFLQTVVEIQAQASRVGISINLPEVTGEEPSDDFARAAADVPRIRALFQLHWRRRTRTMRPMAEEIAAERWELSAADTARLINKFQRKTAVSQR